MRKKKDETPPVYFDEVPTKGRKKKILNEVGASTVEKLASLMCTDEEIASVLGVCVDTLVNENNKDTFSEYKKRGQLTGKSSLRKWQFDSAKRGNVTMQIFLGKNYLGQSDRPDEIRDEDDRNIIINITPAAPENIKQEDEEP